MNATRRGLSCVCLACATLAAACSGGGGSGGGDEFIGPTSIRAFSIDASYLSPPLLGDPVIDASVEGGAFTLSWQIDQPGIAYEAKVYLSETAIHARDEDAKILDLDCGPDRAECADTAVLACALDTRKHIVCDNGADTDLSAWLDVVPKSGYIVLAVSRRGDGSGSGEMHGIAIQIR